MILRYCSAAYRYYLNFGVLLTLKRVVVASLHSILVVVAAVTACSRRMRILFFRFCIHTGTHDTLTLFTGSGPIDGVAPRIGVLIIGGFGDSLFLSAMGTSILERFPGARLFAFVGNKWHTELFAGSALFEAVYCVNTERRDILRLVLPQELDAFYENRYVVLVKSRLATPNERLEHRNRFREYNRNWNTFPLSNHLYGELKLSLFELASRTSGLTIRPDDLSIQLLPADFDLPALFLADTPAYSYITLHHGCDQGMLLPDGSRSQLQTKNWPREKWEEVVSQLSCQGYTVVQLGLASEEAVSGALNLLGKLNIRQTAAILKYAAFHLDTEGGLVHLAQSVKTRSAVVFGPTPVTLFGYQGNENLTAGNCHNCFWSDVRWFQRCPKGNAAPLCMEAVMPGDLIAAAQRLATKSKKRLPQGELFDAEILAASGTVETKLVSRGYPPQKRPFSEADENYQKLETGRMQISEPLGFEYAVRQIGPTLSASGRIIGMGGESNLLRPYLNKSSWSVTAVDTAYSGCSQERKDSRHHVVNKHADTYCYRLASPFILPFDSNSFDALIATEVVESLSNREYALYEMLRIVKPGGLIVVIICCLGSDETRQQMPFDELVKCLSKIGVLLSDDNKVGRFDPFSLGQGVSVGITIRKIS